MFKFNPFTGTFDLVNKPVPQLVKTELLTIPVGQARASTVLQAPFAKYQVYGVSGSKSYSFEMSVFKTGSNVFDTVTHKIGHINMSVYGVLTGDGHIRVEIWNQDIEELNITLIYTSV